MIRYHPGQADHVETVGRELDRINNWGRFRGPKPCRQAALNYGIIDGMSTVFVYDAEAVELMFDRYRWCERLRAASVDESEKGFI